VVFEDEENREQVGSAAGRTRSGGARIRVVRGRSIRGFGEEVIGDRCGRAVKRDFRIRRCKLGQFNSRSKSVDVERVRKESENDRSKNARA
jgi:hypothetical protein